MAQQRPTGITIIAIVSILIAILSLLWSVLVLGFGGLTGLTGSLFNAQRMASFGGSAFVAGGLGILVAVLQLIVAFGLLGLKRWAWLLAVIAYGITVVQGVVGLTEGGFGALCCGAIGLIVPVVILIYLLRGNVRAAFRM